MCQCAWFSIDAVKIDYISITLSIWITLKIHTKEIKYRRNYYLTKILYRASPEKWDLTFNLPVISLLFYPDATKESSSDPFLEINDYSNVTHYPGISTKTVTLSAALNFSLQHVARDIMAFAVTTNSFAPHTCRAEIFSNGIPDNARLYVVKVQIRFL